MTPEEFIASARRTLSRMRGLPIDAPDLLDFITVEEAKELLKCETRQTIYNLIWEDRLRPINPTVGKQRKFFHIGEIENCARNHCHII